MRDAPDLRAAAPGRRSPLPAIALVLAALAAAACAPRAAAAAPAAASPGAAARGKGESQIDESSPDESSSSPARAGAAAALPDRLRAFVEGSLARYDALKSGAAGFRRQGTFPSIFLRDPEVDIELVPAPGGGTQVTAHLSCARREVELRIVVAPVGRLELPEADKRFLSELLGALAAFDPAIVRARLQLWFAVLQPDGQMSWESRGAIGLPAAAVRRVPAGARTAAALWPALDENSLSPAILPEGW